jgi:uncharacterized membrane protein (UPF0127 family)
MLAGAFALMLACRAPDRSEGATDSSGGATPANARAAAPVLERADVAIAGRRFSLELALEPWTRMRGLSGRLEVGDYGGMLFALPNEQPFYLVMRDCPMPIAAIFLDARGSVLEVAEMAVEAPRRADESASAYESRLPRYGVAAGARMAIEIQGGLVSALGVRAGDRVVIEGLDALLRRAK